MIRKNWAEIEKVFHELWGQARCNTYNKQTWMHLQDLLNECKISDSDEVTKVISHIRLKVPHVDNTQSG